MGWGEPAWPPRQSWGGVGGAYKSLINSAGFGGFFTEALVLIFAHLILVLSTQQYTHVQHKTLGVSALKINSYMSNSQNMLHGTCGELPGGARLGGPEHALYKPGAVLVGPSAGQGCAQEDDDDEEDAWCWRPDLELPWTAGWGPQLNGLPASWPWGETEVPQKGHLGREADASVLPLKPEFGVQAWWQAEPKKAVWGPCWSWGAVGQAVASPCELVWRHCTCLLSPAGGAAALLAEPAGRQTRHTEVKQPSMGVLKG